VLEELAKTDDKAPILGLGITTPGPVDTTHGRVDNIPDFSQWNRFNIVDEFKKYVDYNITFERDANAVSLAELYFGYGKQCDDFMVVLSYTGVGLGVVKNRRLYSGKLGLTPELGHITVDMNGSMCTCGNRGCMHEYYGLRVILREVRRDFPQVTGWEEIVDRAYAGEHYFINVVDQYARILSIGIINAINLFAIDTVILSGFNTYRPEMYIRALEGYVRSSYIARNFFDIKVIDTQIQKNANLLGAATAVIEEYLNIH
jgi:predicted NBD/HSP70 family sugar kinase